MTAWLWEDGSPDPTPTGQEQYRALRTAGWGEGSRWQVVQSPLTVRAPRGMAGYLYDYSSLVPGRAKKEPCWVKRCVLEIGGGFCDTCGLRGKCGKHGLGWRYLWLPLQQTKDNLGVPPHARTRNPHFGYQKAQPISSTRPGEAPGASLAGKLVSLGLRTAPLTRLPLPATLGAPRKTWAFPARRHLPGPREAAAATAHQLFSPTLAGAGPALFALSQPGLCVRDRGHRGQGGEQSDGWVGGSGKRLPM